MTADKRIKEEDRMQCTCGRDVSKRWHFCPKCGKLIKNITKNCKYQVPKEEK